MSEQRAAIDGPASNVDGRQPGSRVVPSAGVRTAGDDRRKALSGNVVRPTDAARVLMRQRRRALLLGAICGVVLAVLATVALTTGEMAMSVGAALRAAFGRGDSGEV